MVVLHLVRCSHCLDPGTQPPARIYVRRFIHSLSVGLLVSRFVERYWLPRQSPGLVLDGGAGGWTGLIGQPPPSGGESNADRQGAVDSGTMLFAVPKNKVSRSRRRLRQTHKWMKPDKSVYRCPTCNAFKKRHIALHCARAEEICGLGSFVSCSRCCLALARPCVVLSWFVGATVLDG